MSYYTDRISNPSTTIRSVHAVGGWRTASLCALAALLPGLLYLNALHNPFVYDDYHTVMSNASIAHLWDLPTIVRGAITRPVVNLSYAVDRAVWGPAPFGFHVTSVLLHVLNVALLFTVARIIAKERVVADSEIRLDADVAAFAAASLFAVHPVMTEAVGYISGRSEVLCGTLFLLALLSGRRALEGGGFAWILLTAVLWFGALAAKETAAMFPFVLFCYDRLLLDGTAADRRRRLLTVHAPLATVAVVAGIARLIVLASVEYRGQVSIHWPYLLLDLDVARRYLQMLVLPRGQAAFHGISPLTGLSEPRVWLAVAALGVLALVAWRARRQCGMVSFGALWFVLLLVPSSALILLDQGEVMTEHRVYFASCGLFLAAGGGAGWLALRMSIDRARAVAASAAFAAVLLALGAQTFVRNQVWADPVRLWQESVDLAPRHYFPRLLLGEALEDAGRRNDAIEQYETAMRLRPADSAAHLKLGNLFASTGQFKRASEEFEAALDVDPHNAAASRSLELLARISTHEPDADRARR